MSNGIGRVWAVNAEGGDEGRPNGVGPVYIENADKLGSKLPEPASGDAGKVLGVLNSYGDIGWVVDQSGTLTQVQADWDQTDSSRVSYIANKPSLATVATTGAYSDLSGTPTIPTVDQTYNAASSNAQSGVAVASALSGKQDTISDLSTIRSGASAGATAVQPAALNDYATTSALTTGLASKQDTISDLSTIRSGAAAGATAVQPGDLATVATTGSYDDLLDKPAIPTATSDLQNDSGFITLSDVPAQAQANWSETNPSSPSYIQNKPTIPPGTVVDQTYDATSANAQSGVAVAGALATVKQVPSSTSSDEDKVLTVDSNGDPIWATAQGGSSYTAGDGIAIENDEIKVRVKDDGANPLKVTTQQESGDYASIVTPEGTPSSEGWKALQPDPYYFTREYDEDHDVTHIGFRYLWNRNNPNPLGMVSMSEDSTKHFDAKLHLLWISGKESYTEIVATSDTLSDAFTAGWDGSHSLYTYSLGSLVETTDDGDVFSVEFDVSGDHTGDWGALAFSSSGSDYSGILETVQSSFLSESHVLSLQGDGVYIVGETIPGGDLYVEVDQTFNSWSSKPQSGYAVNDAINSVRQVPTGSWNDTGKALVYDDAEGRAIWADQSSASIGRDGTSLTVRLRNANGSNNSGLAVNTTETPTTITGVVSSGGPNSSYYATFTKAMALDSDTDIVNITGFEASIPSGTLGPVYAIVVAGSTWQSGTLTGGIIIDRDTGDALNLAYPGPCKAFVITDPNDQYAASTFFENVNTFMVFGVSNDNLLYDYESGNFYGPFIDDWKNNGLYSALGQYAVAMTQPSVDVEFEIPSRPSVSRGLYVANPLQAYSIGDAGKVLAVNSDATGTEWVEQPSLSVTTDGVMAGTGTAQDPVVLNYGTGLSTATSQATNLVNITGLSTNGLMTTSFELTAQDCAAINASIASGLGEVSMVPSASFSIIMESAASVDNHVRFRLIDRNAGVNYYGPVVATIPQGQTSVTVDSSNLSHLPLDQFHVGGVSGPALDGSTYALPTSNDYVGAVVSDEEYVDTYDSRTFTINFAEAGVPQLVVSNPVPVSAIADAGKVLTVDNSGAPAWETLALGSVRSIQQVNSLPANPDANTLYLIPEA